MSKDSPQAVVKESVSGSVLTARELAESTLEEASKLRLELDSVLRPQEDQDTAETGREPYSVDVINDVEQINQIIREIRWSIRNISERLAL